MRNDVDLTWQGNRHFGICRSRGFRMVRGINLHAPARNILKIMVSAVQATRLNMVAEFKGARSTHDAPLIIRCSASERDKYKLCVSLPLNRFHSALSLVRGVSDNSRSSRVAHICSTCFISRMRLHHNNRRSWIRIWMKECKRETAPSCDLRQSKKRRPWHEWCGRTQKRNSEIRVRAQKNSVAEKKIGTQKAREKERSIH